MTKTVVLLITAIFCAQAIQAKMLPKDFSVLNQTQVMFEYDQVPGATKYILTIKDANAASTKKPMVFNSSSLAFFVTSGLNFGETYNWKVDALQNSKIIHSTAWLNFSIAWSGKIDTAFARYTIQAPDKNAYHNDLLFMDHLGVIINRAGEPVWYFPEDKLPTSNDQFNFRAMRMTLDGTLTFIYNGRSMERALDGFPIWDAPANTSLSGAESETYHHDLQKMPDGSYITCGYHFTTEPHYLDQNLQAHVRYNTVLQFNGRGGLLWFWNEKDQVDKATIFRNYSSVETEIAGTHLNGFDVNPYDSSMVLSFRNTSEVLKIDMNNFGKVVYGWRPSPKIETGINFSSQHGPSITPEGNIIIYNNNITPERAPAKVHNPKVLIVTNPTGKKPSEKVWEYEIAWSKRPKGIQGKEGYAVQLPNKNILVNVGGAERTFEITPDKRIVWDCTYEKFDTATRTWKPFNNYRCGFISSLYPRYFTLAKNYSAKETLSNSFRINNDGTEVDLYEVEITDANGNTIDQRKVSVSPGAFATVPIGKSKKNKQPEPGTKVKVWPVNSVMQARIMGY